MARWQEAPVAESKKPAPAAPPKAAWQSAPAEQSNTFEGMVEQDIGRFKQAASGERNVFDLPEVVKRPAGMTARAMITGPTQLPALGADAIGFLLNLGIKAFNQTTGKQIPEFPPQSQALEDALTSAGLPSPQTPSERVGYDMAKGVAGVPGNLVAGKALQAGGELSKRVGSALQAAPDVQMAAAAGASGASGVAREMGGGPLAQFGAGLVGGPVAGAGYAYGKAGLASAKDFLASVMNPAKTAGEQLRAAAVNPNEAAQKLSEYEPAVPGSVQTMGGASRDPGLAAKEQYLTTTPAGQAIKGRYAENNRARVAELERLAGTSGELDALKATRKATAEDLYQTAYAEGFDKSALTPQVRGQITNIMSRPYVKQSLKSVKDALASEHGASILERTKVDGSVKGLDYLRRELKARIEKATPNEARILSSTIEELDGILTKISPAIREATATFREQSAPINQMEIPQYLAGKTLTGTDELGVPRLSAAGVMREMKDPNQLAARATNFDRAKYEKILTPAQMQKLENIRKDIDDYAFSQRSNVTGSNTAQNLNMSTAGAIGRIALGSHQLNPKWNVVRRAMAWMNDINAERVDKILTVAAQDPKLAGRLMKETAPGNVNIGEGDLRLPSRNEVKRLLVSKPEIFAGIDTGRSPEVQSKIDHILSEAAKDSALSGTLMKEATPIRAEMVANELRQIAIKLGYITGQNAASKEKRK